MLSSFTPKKSSFQQTLGRNLFQGSFCRLEKLSRVDSQSLSGLGLSDGFFYVHDDGRGNIYQVVDELVTRVLSFEAPKPFSIACRIHGPLRVLVAFQDGHLAVYASENPRNKFQLSVDSDGVTFAGSLPHSRAFLVQSMQQAFLVVGSRTARLSLRTRAALLSLSRSKPDRSKIIAAGGADEQDFIVTEAGFYVLQGAEALCVATAPRHFQGVCGAVVNGAAACIFQRGPELEIVVAAGQTRHRCRLPSSIETSKIVGLSEDGQILICSDHVTNQMQLAHISGNPLSVVAVAQTDLNIQAFSADLLLVNNVLVRLISSDLSKKSRESDWEAVLAFSSLSYVTPESSMIEAARSVDIVALSRVLLNSDEHGPIKSSRHRNLLRLAISSGIPQPILATLRRHQIILNVLSLLVQDEQGEDLIFAMGFTLEELEKNPLLLEEIWVRPRNHELQDLTLIAIAIVFGVALTDDYEIGLDITLQKTCDWLASHDAREAALREARRFVHKSEEATLAIVEAVIHLGHDPVAALDSISILAGHPQLVALAEASGAWPILAREALQTAHSEGRSPISVIESCETPELFNATFIELFRRDVVALISLAPEMSVRALCHFRAFLSDQVPAFEPLLDVIVKMNTKQTTGLSFSVGSTAKPIAEIETMLVIARLVAHVNVNDEELEIFLDQTSRLLALYAKYLPMANSLLDPDTLIASWTEHDDDEEVVHNFLAKIELLNLMELVSMSPVDNNKRYSHITNLWVTLAGDAVKNNSSEFVIEENLLGLCLKQCPVGLLPPLSSLRSAFEATTLSVSDVDSLLLQCRRLMAV